jgi:hypothetical protein
LSFKGELHVSLHILPLDTDRMLTLLHHRIRDLRADDMAHPAHQCGRHDDSLAPGGPGGHRWPLLGI